MRTLRILTLNLWNDAGPWRRRLEVAIEGIRALFPDVVCLQECREVAGGLCQATEIGQALGMGVCFGCVDDRSEAGPIGNAVLSRLPVEEVANARLPGPEDDPRFALRVRLLTPRGALVLVTAHLTYELHLARRREEQVVALDRIARCHPSELPAVICGDFNCTPDSDAIRFLSGRASLGGHSTYWRDAFARVRPREEGYTWSSRNPFASRSAERDRRIDYIFVDNLRPDGVGGVLDCRVVLDLPAPDGVFPSDHFGLLAEVALVPQSEMPVGPWHELRPSMG